VRYDVYRPPEANATSPFAYSQRFRTDKNNIAPRLGVAVGRGKTVVRVSGGIFYDPFQTDLYRRALLNNGTPSFFAISAIPQLPFAPAFPNVFSGVPQGFMPSIQDITSARILQACIPRMRTYPSAVRLLETLLSRPRICSHGVTASQ